MTVLFNFSKKTASANCSIENSYYVILNSKTLDRMKLMIDLKPTVVLDLNAIVEQFPCNSLVAEFLREFVS